MDVKKVTSYIQLPAELLNEWPAGQNIFQLAAESARALAALPPEEQARITAERKTKYEAERCQACGCHPDEHNDY